ncbi:MAG: gamma-glutamylcyclotransferase family protein [Pseudomonadota bacterium]
MNVNDNGAPGCSSQPAHAVPQPAAAAAAAAAPLYFAYGSNLCPAQMQQRTGCLAPGLLCQLEGHRLLFNKRSSTTVGRVFANIVPAPGHTVWGVCYPCSPAMFEALDRHEGVQGGHYQRLSVQLWARGGTPVKAVTYVAGPDFVCEARRPEPLYAQLILDGAHHHGLPTDYLAGLAALTNTMPGER